MTGLHDGLRTREEPSVTRPSWEPRRVPWFTTTRNDDWTSARSCADRRELNQGKESQNPSLVLSQHFITHHVNVLTKQSKITPSYKTDKEGSPRSRSSTQLHQNKQTVSPLEGSFFIDDIKHYTFVMGQHITVKTYLFKGFKVQTSSNLLGVVAANKLQMGVSKSFWWEVWSLHVKQGSDDKVQRTFLASEVKEL